MKKARKVLSIVFLAQIIGLLTSIDALMNTRTSQGTIAWVVSLNAVPYLAVPAYWIFGRSKFHGYVEAWNRQQDRIEPLRKQVLEQLQPYMVDAAGQVPDVEGMSRLARMPLLTGNNSTLLVDGESKFSDLFQGLEQARNYILLEYYILRDDRIGQALIDLLVKKAASGVDVYLIYDEIGSNSLSKKYIQALRESGLKLTAFNTTQGRRNRFQLNFRNHRKLVIVDGHTAWIGGINVGDEYLGHDPKLSPWRDTHVRVEGPAVLAAQRTFLADWNWATGELITLDWQPKPAASNQSQAIWIVASSPADELETAQLFFTHLIQSAKQRLWIATPYFIPDEGMINALILAALRGVDVRILMPDQPDGPWVDWAGWSAVDKLADSSIRVFRYEDGFMHQKVVLVDNDVSSVGSANFDNRSFRLNFELSAVVVDEQFAEEIERMLQKDFSNSRELTDKSLQAHKFSTRLMARISHLFAPIL